MEWILEAIHLQLLPLVLELLLDASPLGMFLSSATITLQMMILTTEIKIPPSEQAIYVTKSPGRTVKRSNSTLAHKIRTLTFPLKTYWCVTCMRNQQSKRVHMTHG